VRENMEIDVADVEESYESLGERDG